MIQIGIGTLIPYAVAFLLIWLVGSFIFWIAGRIVTGLNAEYREAFIVAFIGALIAATLYGIFYVTLYVTGLQTVYWWAPAVASTLITLFAYVPLCMRFFDVGFWGAIAVGFIVIVISVLIIAMVASILGVVILALFPQLFIP
ncbi:MAG: hypothetical protein ACFFDP_03610 [Promethearchaeota archaeon]